MSSPGDPSIQSLNADPPSTHATTEELDTPPIDERRPGSPRNRTSSSRMKTVLQLAKSLFLPFVAIVYLSFCYVVAARPVPVVRMGMSTSTQHLSMILSPSLLSLLTLMYSNLASVKAGITAISILVVTIGLLPLTSLIGDLKVSRFQDRLEHLIIFQDRAKSFFDPFAHTGTVSLSPPSTIYPILPSVWWIQLKPSCAGTPAAILWLHLLQLFSQPPPRLWRQLLVCFCPSLSRNNTINSSAVSVELILMDTELMAFKVGAIGVDTILKCVYLHLRRCRCHSYITS